MDIPNQKWKKGNNLIFEPNLVCTYSGLPLIKDVDYIVIFSNNKVNFYNDYYYFDNPATATIVGIGDYFGTVAKTFDIVDGNPKPKDDNPWFWVIIGGIFLVAGSGFLVYYLAKRKKKM